MTRQLHTGSQVVSFSVVLLLAGCIDYEVPARAPGSCAEMPCSSDATCDDSGGHVVCTCGAGYTGDGYTCTDVDECAGEAEGHNCHQHAVCTNTTGSYACTCKAGYLGEGIGCESESIPYVCWDVDDQPYTTFALWDDAMDAMVSGHASQIEVHEIYISYNMGHPINDYQWGEAGKQAVVVLGGVAANSYRWAHSSIDVLAQLIAEHPELAETYTFHYIPLLNPEGYHHSWQGYKDHLKNMAWTSGECRGIHLGRNFDVDWEAGHASSTDTCNPYYRGAAPFRAKEAAALVPHILGLDSIHAFIEFEDISWGNLCFNDGVPTLITTPVPGNDRAQSLAELGAAITGVPAVGGHHDTLLYPVSGSPIRWFVESAGVPGEHATKIYMSGALSPDEYRDQAVNYLVDWLGLLESDGD